MVAAIGLVIKRGWRMAMRGVEDGDDCGDEGEGKE
jgi:hypothetical protein